MPKRCPPGVICIENITIVFVIIFICFVILFLNQHYSKNKINEKVIIREKNERKFGLFPSASFGNSNMPNDVLLNPYEPPLSDERVYPKDSSDPRGIPINISTQSVDTPYRQVGILTRLKGNNGENILPLMGKPLITNRDKWNYYTMTDKNHMIKLPITHKGRSCTNEYGCDSMYNGDSVYVEGYEDAFKVTIYDNNVTKYIPYL